MYCLELVYSKNYLGNICFEAIPNGFKSESSGLKQTYGIKYFAVEMSKRDEIY